MRADGERGMVMSVFTLPGYPLVFKLIRDRFAYPKDIARAGRSRTSTGWCSAATASAA